MRFLQTSPTEQTVVHLQFASLILSSFILVIVTAVALVVIYTHDNWVLIVYSTIERVAA